MMRAIIDDQTHVETITTHKKTETIMENLL